MSADAVHLLRETIQDLGTLELLLLLARDPQAWKPRDLSIRVGRQEAEIAASLARLARDGLVREDTAAGTVAFAPGNDADRETVQHVADLYDSSLVEVVRVLNEAALRRIRDSAADILRRTKPPGGD
jgi:hypothetical protein